MTFRRLPKLSLLFLLTICLLTSPAISLGCVWCVSADGHAMQETPFSCDCGGGSLAPRAADCPDVTLTANTDGCGPCRETPTTPRWSSPPARSTEDPVNFPVWHAPVNLSRHHPRSDRFLTNHLVIVPALRTPSSVLHQRTIVLEI